MRAGHGLPHNRFQFSVRLEQVKKALNPHRNDIKPSSQKVYAKRVLKRVIDKEPDLDPNKKIKTSGEIKIRGLSDKRAKQSDPRLAWMMFHSIVKMYRQVKEKENLANLELSQGDTPRCESGDDDEDNLSKSKAYDEDVVDSTVDEKLVDTIEKVIADDLEDIQPRPSQVWNILVYTLTFYTRRWSIVYTSNCYPPKKRIHRRSLFVSPRRLVGIELEKRIYR